MHTFRKPIVILVFILLIATGLKVWLLLLKAVPFNSDEAIVGLMARHITLGERPVFFYGQTYMGSLDAFLVSFVFQIFGSHVWGIRLVQILLYALTILAVYGVAKTIFNSVEIGLLAAAIMAVPTVNVTLYTTASLGGYGEALLLGTLLLWIAFKIFQIMDSENSSSGYQLSGLLFLWGGLLGLGIWANGLTLVFGMPGGIGIVWKIIEKRKKLDLFGLGAGILMFFGVMIGSLPWWIYALQHGPSRLVGELLGGAVSVETVSWVAKTLQHLVNLILLGSTAALGLRPPWAVQWLGLPLIPVVLIFWFFVFRFWVQKLGKRSDTRLVHWVLLGVPLTVTAGFLFTSFGVDPSGRYFVPLLVPMSLIAAEMIMTQIRSWYWRGGLTGLLIVFHFIGIVQCAINNPPGLSTQFDQTTAVDQRFMGELIQFLHEVGETRGYSNYWVAYPLAFESDEQLIFIPRLPYHYDMRYTTRDDRYPLYTEIVNSGEKWAYITSGQEALEKYLRFEFLRMGITWKEKIIGDFRVFYSLSSGVRVQEIGLGENFP